MVAKGSAKARRSAARLAAVQVLYQMRLGGQDARAALARHAPQDAEEHDGDTQVTPDAEMLQGIVEGVEARWEDVDRIVSKSLADGGRTQVETLLDCILRAGVWELLARADIDAGIIINDYLNVTAGFYDGGEYKLVNAILDRTAKAVRG